MNNRKAKKISKKIWTSKELKRLQNLCAKCHSFQELGKKAAKSFPKRTQGSVQSQTYQHGGWIKHFEKKTAIFLNGKERKLPEILKEGPKTLKEISALLDVPKEEIFPIRDKFAELGYNIEIKKGPKETIVSLIAEPSPDKEKNEKPAKITSNVMKVLFISDICFGLKTQQPTLLETAYKIGEEEGVFFAVIAGNIVAGKPQKAKEKDYFLLTAEEQLDYAIRHIPKASFKTTFINGPRDLSWEAGEDGINIGEALAKERQDLSCKDDLKTTLSIGKKEKVKIGVMCASGSDPYTKSYTLQGISENLQEAEYYVFEHSDPLQMILMGGTHTALLDPRRFPFNKSRINDFDKIAIPALHRIPSSQTVSKKRGGSHVLGCVIVSFELNDEGYLKSIPLCEFYNMTAYFKENDYLLHPTGELADKSLDKEEQDLLNLLADKPRRKGSLSRRLKISEDHIQDIVKKLEGKGIAVTFNDASKSYYRKRALQEEFKPLDTYTSQFFPEKFQSTEKPKTKKAKTVDMSDTHLGHKHERPDLIKEVYNVAEAEQADAVLHSGDVFEGEDSYRGQVRELAYVGADAQRDHGLEIWPASKIPTFFIMGSSHEKVFLDKCGYDIISNFVRLAKAEKGLNLTVLETSDGSSGSRGIVDVNGIKFCLDHPSGGIPYGRSYRPQKLIENMVSDMELFGEAKVILCGHLHVSLFMLYKGVAGFMVPCLQDKTKYIEAKGYTPWLGIWVVEVNMDEYENITRIVPKYIPYEPKKKREAYQVTKKDK